MATNYPTSLDTTASHPAAGSVGANLSTFPHSTLHGNANDAIIAIETELGLAPSDTFSSVKTRLDSIASTLAATTAQSATTFAKLATITPAPGALSLWTMAVTQGVAVSSTNNWASYSRVGRQVSGSAWVTVSSTGTAANIIGVSMPVGMAVSSVNGIIGKGFVQTAAGIRWPGTLVYGTSTACNFWREIETSSTATYLGAAGLTAALTAGAVISVQFQYEAFGD